MVEMTNFVKINLKLISGRMKKIIVSISFILLIAIITVSCNSTQRCAAYGERQRYQIERH